MVAAAVGGNREISEAKLKKVLGEDFFLAPRMTVREVLGTEPGYVGFIDLPEEVELIPDLTIKNRINFECGANETDYHLLNLNFGRDIAEPDNFYDIRQVKNGEKCPRCGEGKLYPTKATGLISFSSLDEEDLECNLTFNDKDGEVNQIDLWQAKISLTDLFACAVEKSWDEDGLIWPDEIAPYDVHLLSLGGGKIAERAEEVYIRLREEGLEVLWDDRDCKAGVKFNDSDLFGIPVRLVIGKKSLDKDALEFKRRGADETLFLKEEEIISRIKERKPQYLRR